MNHPIVRQGPLLKHCLARLAARMAARLPAALPALTLALFCGAAQAATSVLIWPIDPVLESDQRAAALWLENHDTQPVGLQVRVLGWSQVNGDDVYDTDQTRVTGSPPMTVVAPGQRQLIRLTKLADVAPGKEEAYRVLIDEVPVPGAAGADSTQNADASFGVHFQMHYSIPLFVDGAGVWTKDDPNRRRTTSATQPVLGWHIEQSGGKRWLIVTNHGIVHARLTQISFETQGAHADVERGLLGYALPGSTMRWQLSNTLALGPQSKLIATVNGHAGVAIDPDSRPAGQ